MLFVPFVFLNLFIAVILEAFYETKDENGASRVVGVQPMGLLWDAWVAAGTQNRAKKHGRRRSRAMDGSRHGSDSMDGSKHGSGSMDSSKHGSIDWSQHGSMDGSRHGSIDGSRHGGSMDGSRHGPRGGRPDLLRTASRDGNMVELVLNAGPGRAPSLASAHLAHGEDNKDDGGGVPNRRDVQVGLGEMLKQGARRLGRRAGAEAARSPRFKAFLSRLQGAWLEPGTATTRSRGTPRRSTTSANASASRSAAASACARGPARGR